MSVLINDEALQKAADDMHELQLRNKRLKEKLEKMYQNLLEALDTPAGHAVQWTGREVLIQPIDDMGKVINFMSETLNTIIGLGEEGKGKYYDKLFDEYNELDQILKNKSTK